MPKVLPSSTYRLATRCGNFYLTVIFNPSKTRLVEILTLGGKAGGCPDAHLRALSSVVTKLLQAEKKDWTSVLKMFNHLSGTHCLGEENSCIGLVFTRLLELGEEMKRDEDRCDTLCS